MRFILKAFGLGMCMVFAQAGAFSLGLDTPAWLSATVPLAIGHGVIGFAEMGGVEAYVEGRQMAAWTCALAAAGLAFATWALAAWVIGGLSLHMSTTAAELLIVLAWFGAAACGAAVRIGAVRAA